jgi:hypothetical protein
MKWVFPALWIGGFGLGTCALWFGAFDGPPGKPVPESVKWLFLAAWVGGTFWVVWDCRRLKRVQVDDEALYVSDYLSETRIPLTDVSHFTESPWSRPPTVTIHLLRSTAVGQRVVFIPVFKGFLSGGDVIIVELQALRDRANTRG